MTKCPICVVEMKKENKEIEKGIFADIEICPKCQDEWINEKEYDRLINLKKQKK